MLFDLIYLPEHILASIIDGLAGVTGANIAGRLASLGIYMSEFLTVIYSVWRVNMLYPKMHFYFPTLLSPTLPIAIYCVRAWPQQTAS